MGACWPACPWCALSKALLTDRAVSVLKGRSGGEMESRQTQGAKTAESVFAVFIEGRGVM